MDTNTAPNSGTMSPLRSLADIAQRALCVWTVVERLRVEESIANEYAHLQAEQPEASKKELKAAFQQLCDEQQYDVVQVNSWLTEQGLTPCLTTSEKAFLEQPPGIKKLKPYQEQFGYASDTLNALLWVLSCIDDIPFRNPSSVRDNTQHPGIGQPVALFISPCSLREPGVIQEKTDDVSQEAVRAALTCSQLVRKLANLDFPMPKRFHHMPIVDPYYPEEALKLERYLKQYYALAWVLYPNREWENKTFNPY